MIQDIVEAQGDHVTMLVDDNPEITEFRGIDVTHAMPQTKEPTIISIGNNRIRRMIAESVKKILMKEGFGGFDEGFYGGGFV